MADQIVSGIEMLIALKPEYHHLLTPEAALTYGAQVFMASMENHASDWQAVMEGHSNLRDAFTGMIGPDSGSDADVRVGKGACCSEERNRTVPQARDVFVETKQGLNQLGIKREDVAASAEDLLTVA